MLSNVPMAAPGLPFDPEKPCTPLFVTGGAGFALPDDVRLHAPAEPAVPGPAACPPFCACVPPLPPPPWFTPAGPPVPPAPPFAPLQPSPCPPCPCPVAGPPGPPALPVVPIPPAAPFEPLPVVMVHPATVTFCADESTRMPKLLTPSPRADCPCALMDVMEKSWMSAAALRSLARTPTANGLAIVVTFWFDRCHSFAASYPP